MASHRSGSRLSITDPEKGKALAHDAEAQRVLHDAAPRLLAGDSLTAIAASFKSTGVLSPRDWYRAKSG